MFICRACCRRALSSTLVTHPIPSRLCSASQATNAFRSLDSSRNLATAAATTPNAALPRENEATSVSTTNSRDKAIRWKVKKHLEFLDNNYKIAEHVERTLEREDYDEALLLVREATRKGDVTVSWNHLIGYLMRKQRLHAAVKLYNEMKKRDQMPNAQTYTILFRGFANSDHPTLAVSEAVRIYHTMMTSKRLQPNVIHMNAVLEVCGRAGDMDSLFSIVSTADEKLRSPDNRTYTIILNSLRPKIPTHRLPRRKPEEEEDEAEPDAERDPAVAADMAVINQAKAIWEEVITRWRKAKIIIDERLVCAMGRLLRHGGREENDEILDLVEQTMDIPRQDKVSASLPSQERPQPSEEADRPTQVIRKIKEHGRNGPKPRPVGYAVPGNNTLSLILESLRATRKTTLGPRYWDLFVNEYKVRPDKENYASYLRLLRVGHNSTKTADIIQEIPPAMLTPKTFRIGLSCCVRDNLNKHAFANATRVFRAMKALRVPDPMAMRLYLQATRANFRPVTANLSEVDGKFALGRQIAIALDNMWEPFGTLTRSFSFSSIVTCSPEEAWQRSSNEQMEAMAVAKRMVAAMDFVVTEEAADARVIKQLRTRRNILNRYVVMYNDRIHKMENKIKSLERVDVDEGASESRVI
ncbi:hypothetical protein CONLIGDRAFT_666970 [Coniochaeta ligniaria NRRL 30616]|uniref:Pentatricopeptide repeat protein n=1 Tax=Coniochaeta ligniaria NRRL 30616 TaxID=1408157 RepID=A0A1J7JWD7_9PEZI|nr:hypothetical protein CONLIGDRAFT_666970 [Coniochaeta ligniaria NRRL 30616]